MSERKFHVHNDLRCSAFDGIVEYWTCGYETDRRKAGTGLGRRKRPQGVPFQLRKGERRKPTETMIDEKVFCSRCSGWFPIKWHGAILGHCDNCGLLCVTRRADPGEAIAALRQRAERAEAIANTFCADHREDVSAGREVCMACEALKYRQRAERAEAANRIYRWEWQYIADSPGPEFGGFKPNLVERAKDILKRAQGKP